MAEATHEEKIAAMAAALASFDVTDAVEAERYVAAIWSQVPLFPKDAAPSPEPAPAPEPQPQPELLPSAYVTLMLASADPELAPRIAKLNEEAEAIAKLIVERQ